MFNLKASKHNRLGWQGHQPIRNLHSWLNMSVLDRMKLNRHCCGSHSEKKKEKKRRFFLFPSFFVVEKNFFCNCCKAFKLSSIWTYFLPFSGQFHSFFSAMLNQVHVPMKWFSAFSASLLHNICQITHVTEIWSS